MSKSQTLHRLQYLSVEDAYIKRILKRAVRRLKCRGLRLVLRQNKELQLNMESL
jgi:hypothetical protein